MGEGMKKMKSNDRVKVHTFFVGRCRWHNMRDHFCKCRIPHMWWPRCEVAARVVLSWPWTECRTFVQENLNKIPSWGLLSLYCYCYRHYSNVYASYISCNVPLNSIPVRTLYKKDLHSTRHQVSIYRSCWNLLNAVIANYQVKQVYGLSRVQHGNVKSSSGSDKS